MSKNTFTIEQLDEKEKELQEQFNKEQHEAMGIEQQIKILEAKFQEKTTNIVKIQGAFALIRQLKKENVDSEPEDTTSPLSTPAE